MKYSGKYRILSFLMASMMLLGTVVACGTVESPEATTTAGTASATTTTSATAGTTTAVTTTTTAATTTATTATTTAATTTEPIVYPPVVGTVSYTAPAIRANVGDVIDLLAYRVQTSATTALEPSKLTWSSTDLTIQNNKVTAPAKGVYKLTAKSATIEKPVYLVVKEKNETEYVLYETDFADASSIADWKKIQQTSGAKYSVANGKLTMDASNSASSYVRLMLPEFLNDFGDYHYEATGTITKAQNTSRWMSLMFRIQKKDYPYYQLCARQNATASNGTEFAERTAGNKWNVTHTVAYSSKIAAGSEYTLAVDICGETLATSINGTRLVYTKAANKYLMGGLGLQVNGCCATFNSLKVTLIDGVETTKTDLVQVREVKSNLNQTPTIVTYVNSADELNNILTDSPATAILRVNSALDVLDGKGSKFATVADAMKKLNRQVIPAFYVSDEATVKAVCNYLKQEKFIDAFVMSDKAELVRLARDTESMVRGILDFSAVTAQTDITSLHEAANAAGARIAVLPASLATGANVEAIQRLLTTVWVQSEKDTTVELVSHITSGANGIITQNRKELERCFTAYFEKNTLTRVINVIGHRGQPSTGQENSIASSIEAYDAGATMIENDVYLSKDGVVVVMHDSTIDRTTNGVGKVESMTVAELQQYVIDGNADAAPQPIPTLEDYFKEFQGKDVQIVIEIKTNTIGVLEPMAALIKQYKMENQVNFITFNHEMIAKCKELLPGVSVGYLTSGITLSEEEDLLTVERILAEVQKYDTTFNPSYSKGALGSNIMAEAAHRGITFWPWTVNDRAHFDQYFLYGTNGITTNYSTYYSDYIKTIATEKDAYSVKVGSETELSLIRTNYDREQIKSTAGGMKIVSGNESGLSYQNGKLTAKEAGEYTVIFSHSCKLNNGETYYTYSQPVTITVTK